MNRPGQTGPGPVCPTRCPGTFMSTLPTTDSALLEETLEIAATRSDDITPEVFAAFFARCPEAQHLFTVLDPAAPPLGCGQMLFEIISLMTDAAAGRPHVQSYMHQIATDHVQFKVVDLALYREFLNALVDVLARLLGPQWTAAHAAAWARQGDALLKNLPAAHTTP